MLFPEGDLERAKQRQLCKGLDLRWSRSSGASEREIEACERRLRKRLPEDVRAFLRSSNGLVIEQGRVFRKKPGPETYLSKLALLGCNDIAARSQQVWEDVAEDPAIRNLLCVADYGDGNFVLFDTRKKSGSIVDGFCEEISFWARGAPTIADSFSDFAHKLMRALEHGTPMKYWLGESP